jgi:small subunit ribosomal protein S14
MKYLVPKDKIKRFLYNKGELRRIILKTLFTDQRLEPKVRLLYFRKLANFDRNASRVRVRNRCIVTGRSHGLHRYFRLSRFQLKRLANEGFLVGIEKTGW